MNLLAEMNVDGRSVGLFLSRYQSPGAPVPAIQCYAADADAGGFACPYGRLSVNPQNERGRVPWTVNVRDSDENEAIAAAALQTGVFEDLCRPHVMGHASAAVWRIVPERIQIDAFIYAMDELRWDVTARQALAVMTRALLDAGAEPPVLVVGDMDRPGACLSLRLGVDDLGRLSMRALHFDGASSRDLTDFERAEEVDPAIDSGSFRFFVDQRVAVFDGVDAGAAIRSALAMVVDSVVPPAIQAVDRQQ